MKAKNWNTCQIWNCTDSSVNLAKIMSDLIKDYDNGFNTLPISILSALEHLAILSSTKIDLEDKWNKYYIRILLHLLLNVIATTFIIYHGMGFQYLKYQSCLK